MQISQNLLLLPLLVHIRKLLEKSGFRPNCQKRKEDFARIGPGAEHPKIPEILVNFCLWQYTWDCLARDEFNGRTHI